MPEILTFQRGTPRTDRCCLCDKREVSQIETRCTGKDGEVQQWSYCSSCWSMEQEGGSDPDLVAQKYLVFLRWIFAGYRLERRPSAGRIYRIVPKRGSIAAHS